MRSHFRPNSAKHKQAMGEFAHGRMRAKNRELSIHTKLLTENYMGMGTLQEV